MPEVDPQFFVDAMARAGVSQRKLAKLIGLDHSALSLKLRGLREMKAHEAAEVARLLAVPLNDVLAAAGVRVPGDSTVPLVGFVDGEGEVHLTMDERAERMAAPAELAGNAMAVQVHAATGPLHMIDGWSYFFRQPAEVPRDIAGNYAVAKLVGGVALLRFVTRGYRPGTFNLISEFHMPPIENAKLEWAAPVLWIKPSH